VVQPATSTNTDLLKPHPQQAGIQGNFNRKAVFTNQELAYILRIISKRYNVSVTIQHHPTFLQTNFVSWSYQKKHASLH
jgi:hypothetical protein